MVVFTRAQLSAAIGALSSGSHEVIEWRRSSGTTRYIFDWRKHRSEYERERLIAGIKRRIRQLPKESLK